VEYLVADILAQRACDLTHRRLHGLQRQERSRELSRLQVPAEQAPGREAEAPRQPDRGQAERCLVPPNARKDTNRPRRRGARSEPIPNGGPRTLLRGSWRAHLRGRVTWARPRAAFPRCGVCTPADRRADDHRCPSTGGFLPPDDRRAGPGGAAGAGTGIWGTGPWRSVVQGQRRSGGHGRGGQHGRLAAGAPTGASPPATYRVEGGVPVGDQAVSGGSEPQGAQPSVPAFAALVEPHLTPVSRMLRGLLPTSQDAEDVLQDTLLHAYVGMAGLRRMDVFGPWLRTIAYNRAMQWQRRRYAERHAGPLPWHLGQVPGPEAQVELHADVTTALGLLSAADRDAVILRYAQGFTSAEVGRLQGEIASTVRWRLRRALGVLRTALAAAEPAPMEANRDGGRDGIDGRRDDPGAARRT